MLMCLCCADAGKMPEGITPEALVNNIMDTLNDGLSKHKGGSLFDENASSVSSQFNRLFGREKPVHHILGGGKCEFFFVVLIWYKQSYHI